MKYILSDETVTVIPPSGLYLVLTDIEGDGTVEIKDSTGTTLTSNPVPQKYAFPIDVIATGDVSVSIMYAGDQTTGDRIFESNGSTGHYPGRWGSGVGSK